MEISSGGFRVGSRFRKADRGLEPADGRQAGVDFARAARLSVAHLAASVLIVDKPRTGDAVAKLLHEGAPARGRAGRRPDPVCGTPGGRQPAAVAGAEGVCRLAAGKQRPDGDGSSPIPPAAWGLGPSGIALAAARLSSVVNPIPVRVAYGLVQSHFEEKPAPASIGDFFAGLNLAPGSDARRKLPTFNGANVEAQMKIAKAQETYPRVLGHGTPQPAQSESIVGRTVRQSQRTPPRSGRAANGPVGRRLSPRPETGTSPNRR